MGRPLAASAVLLCLATPLQGQTAPAPAVRLSGYLQARETYQDGTDLTAAPWVVLRGEIVAQHRNGGAGADDWGWYLLAAVPVLPWLQPVAKAEWFDRPAVADASQKHRAWTAGANLFPWSRSTRLSLEYLSREIGEPGDRRGVALAQAQVVF